MKFFKTTIALATLLGCLPTSPAEVAFPGPAPGTASAEQSASGYTLSNNILTAKFILRNGSLSFGGMTSKLGPVAKAGDELFIINLQDGRSIKSSELKAGNVKFVSLQPNPKAFRLADRFRAQGPFPLPAAGTPPGKYEARPDEKHRSDAI